MPAPIVINQTATLATPYIPAATGARPPVVTSYVISSTGIVTVQWKDTDGNALSGPMQIAANDTLVVPYNPDGHMQAPPAKGIQLVQTGGGTLGGHFTYLQ